MSSKKTISAGIAIDGEKAFKQAVSDINSNLSVLKTEMKLVTAEFADNADSQEALTAKQKVLSKQIEEQKSKISTLETALENAKKAYSENTELLPKMEAKLSDARKELEKVSAEFGENSDEAKAAQKSLDEAQKGYDDVAKAVKSSRSTMDTWQKSLNTAKTDLIGLNKELDSSDMDDYKESVEAAEKELSDFSEETENAEEKTSNFGDVLGKIGNVAKVGIAAATAAITAASTAIVALTKSAIEGYAEYEQLIGGVETLFKESSDKVTEYANDAYKTAGLSANEYMETVTGFSASLLQSLNNDTAAAAEKADMAITDMSDNANKMGSDIESLKSAYAGFAKGQYTLLDNLKLGYGGTKTEMERLLSDAQKISGVKYDLSSYSDIIDAIHVVQTEMDITGTTAREASTTISGSVSSMKSAWGNLVTGIADENANFDQLIDNFVDSVSTVGDNLLPRIEIALNGAAKLVDELVPKIVDALPGLIESVLPKLTTSAINIVSSLCNGLSQNASELVQIAIELITTLINGIVDSLPLLLTTALEIIISLANGLADSIPELIPTIVDVVLQIVETLTNPDTLVGLIDAALQIILALADGLVKSIPKIVDKIPIIIANLISAIIQCLPLILEAGIELIMTLIEGVVSRFGSIIQTGKDIVDKVKSGFTDKIADAKTWGKDMIQNFIDGITAKWQDLKNKVSDVAQTVKDFLGFSEPKEGPLSNFHTYSPDMIDLFVQGIQENEYKLRDQMNKSLNFDVGRIDGQIAAAQPSAQMTAMTYSQVSSTDNNLMIKMIELLTVIAANSNRPIVLDSGAVVGGIADQVDTQLGYILAEKQRG